MMPARRLGPTAASLPGLPHDGPMTGWDLVATAQRRIGGYGTLPQNQVHRELAARRAGRAHRRPDPRSRRAPSA